MLTKGLQRNDDVIKRDADINIIRLRQALPGNIILRHQFILHSLFYSGD